MSYSTQVSEGSLKDFPVIRLSEDLFDFAFFNYVLNLSDAFYTVLVFIWIFYFRVKQSSTVTIALFWNAEITNFEINNYHKPRLRAKRPVHVWNCTLVSRKHSASYPIFGTVWYLMPSWHLLTVAGYRKSNCTAVYLLTAHCWYRF